MTWIEQLQETKRTLLKLQDSIGGDSPSQCVMWDKLQAAIQIIQTQITVEVELMP